MTVELTAAIRDFCGGIHVKATMTVCLDQNCVLKPSVSRILDTTKKIFPLIGGTISVDIESTDDLEPVPPITDDPNYIVTLAAPGWAGCEYTGPINSDTSLFALLV